MLVVQHSREHIAGIIRRGVVLVVEEEGEEGGNLKKKGEGELSPTTSSFHGTGGIIKPSILFIYAYSIGGIQLYCSSNKCETSYISLDNILVSLVCVEVGVGQMNGGSGSVVAAAAGGVVALRLGLSFSLFCFFMRFSSLTLYCTIYAQRKPD